MTRMKVLKPFHDVKHDKMRQDGEEFADTNERALELAKKDLILVLEIDKPKAKRK